MNTLSYVSTDEDSTSDREARDECSSPMTEDSSLLEVSALEDHPETIVKTERIDAGYGRAEKSRVTLII